MKAKMQFAALAALGAMAVPAEAAREPWCNGDLWYNSVFGSRHYSADKNGKLVHDTRFRESNPGSGMTCFIANSNASYSFGHYANSNYARTDYVGLGYEFARPRVGGITVAPGVFLAAATGYPKLATPGLGGLTLMPGFSLSLRGEKYGAEIKTITDPSKDKRERNYIFGFQWMMRF